MDFRIVLCDFRLYQLWFVNVCTFACARLVLFQQVSSALDQNCRGLWRVLAIYYFQLWGLEKYKAMLIRAILFQNKPFPGEKRNCKENGLLPLMHRITILSQKSHHFIQLQWIHIGNTSKRLLTIGGISGNTKKTPLLADTHIGQWQTDIPITQHKFEQHCIWLRSQNERDRSRYFEMPTTESRWDNLKSSLLNPNRVDIFKWHFSCDSIVGMMSARAFHVTGANMDILWRQRRRLPKNITSAGPLTDAPDYSFVDGRPAPLGVSSRDPNELGMPYAACGCRFWLFRSKGNTAPIRFDESNDTRLFCPIWYQVISCNGLGMK